MQRTCNPSQCQFSCYPYASTRQTWCGRLSLLLTCMSCEGRDTPAISLFLHVLVLTAQSQATSREGKLAGRPCRTAVM
jgi:hypothetical protein